MRTDVQNFAVANLRRRPEPVEVGGFVAGFDPSTKEPYLNYATPLAGCRPTDADVAALIGAFRERGLLPRLEFAPDAVPEVAPALRRAGFVTEATHSYLVCTPEALTPPAGPGVPVVETPGSDEEYAAVDAALSAAFGGEFPPSAEGVARLRRTEDSGGATRFVRAPGGLVAGAGTCSPPAEGTSELAGVGTRPEFRGRGVAGAVTAALTAALFDRGAESVWLEASGDGSRRVYERLGYRVSGTRLYLRLP
ncbi:GNAT family N-acetyltransferase [Streptomyces sp. NPDC020875]|uniref:GNAT family N-acetyltransferase n=1 Tax=Streptomyces sp. NPDC020875 TaxID=3154898 RepID=UPI0033E14C1C